METGEGGESDATKFINAKQNEAAFRTLWGEVRRAPPPPEHTAL